jgi:purine-nucleoside phosphorylase
MNPNPPPFEETLRAIKALIPTELAHPKIGIVCGSGLSTLASHFKDKIEVPYEGLPGFVKGSTVAVLYLNPFTYASTMRL